MAPNIAAIPRELRLQRKGRFGVCAFELDAAGEKAAGRGTNLTFSLNRELWNGFLRLSLVTCPVALYPPTSDSEKVSFNQINKKTGHRIKYVKVDADTGEEVPNEDITKGFKVDTDTYVEVFEGQARLENVALESTRTIEIDEFVPKADIDPVGRQAG